MTRTAEVLLAEVGDPGRPAAAAARCQRSFLGRTWGRCRWRFPPPGDGGRGYLFVWPALRMPGYPGIIDAVLGTAFARTYTSLPWAGDRAHLFWFPRLPEFKLLSPATPSLQVRQTPARGNELRKIARLVNREASGRESPSSFPPHLGGGSDASPFLGPLEMGLTALPSPQAPLAGSLSSSGCTSDLQMWVCGVQQRVSPLSFHP